jgi:RNA polymerase sigma factor (TIGR02999 family)
MNDDVTRILKAIDAGDPRAAAGLLPLVYDELRRLASQRLVAERPGQTLQPTALVHEAYLRLLGDGPAAGTAPQWDGRGHFFAAAAEAMRRVLIDNARHKRRPKHGGDRTRVPLDEAAEVADLPPLADDLLELDAALDRLQREDAESAQLVKLRYFAGLTNAQAAELMDVSPRHADRLWSFARAWLRRELA